MVVDNDDVEGMYLALVISELLLSPSVIDVISDIRMLGDQGGKSGRTLYHLWDNLIVGPLSQV